ncbi:hypothetical protein K2X30_14535 [bacterium]|nr:hypothetical protein [bacterium]
MATFKDGPSKQAQSWIHDLAKSELHPDAEKLLNLGRNFDPQQVVEESAIDFLTVLRGHFNEYAKVFNSYAEGGNRYQEVKIYSIAQTPADFMMYRNQIKLLVSNAAHGVIQLGFFHHLRGALAVDGQVQSPIANQASSAMSGTPQAQTPPPQDLLAQIGPFRDVYWTYQGEKIEAEQIAKFYFSEFIRATRDLKRSRAANQALLDQIKTLLQEKGLEL